jgi:hypothetical protein
MEETYSSVTPVDFRRTTRRYIPENRTLHNHRCENLKFYKNKTDEADVSRPQYCLNLSRSASEQYRIKSRKVVVTFPGDALGCSADHVQWKEELHHFPSIQLIFCLNTAQN